ncbi:MAG: hypothetical protein A3B68_05510 [Candidatus Melainabacteria bacterium RIFCSPHIGHO2_02_FULL_34_12]|nr:MAG: hypothetical protein A3B68_05510 [Candidatus Melainabacteria bacterium RIFCSPHIGHO2_02_FULL_34_12]
MIVLVFYLWLAGSDAFNFHMDHGGAGGYISYNHLTDAFLAGKLHLSKEPDPKLLELADPYDPWTNMHYRWHDASLYKGKYYLYFGITPVILLYLPFKLLTGLTMTDRLASVLFMFGVFAWAVAILLFIQRTYFQKIENWKIFLSVAVLGIANWGPFMVREDNGLYNVAILCGLFFLMGSIYLFIKAAHEEKNRITRLLLGSLFMGLAAGARPTILVMSVLFLLVWNKIKKNIDSKTRFNAGLALILPFFVCASLIGLYNYLRFGNIFEFGFTYQVGLYNFAKERQFDIANLFITPFYYLFNPPAVNSVFPYIHNDGPFIMYPILAKVTGFFNKEPVVGILSTVPFIFIPLFYLFTKLIQKSVISSNNITFPKFEFKLIFLSLIINSMFVFLIPATCMRYSSEIITFLLLIVIILWYYLCLKFDFTNKTKIILDKIAIILAVVSLIIWSALGISELRTRNRIDYFMFKDLFKPISNIFLEKETDWKNIVVNIISIPITLKYNDLVSINSELEAANDNDVYSNWIIPGNRSITIEAIPKELSVIKSIWLLSRQTKLFESWEKLNVQFYLNGNLSAEMNFSFPDTYLKRIQHAKFSPIKTDKMVLTFSEPVVVDRWGHPVPPEGVNPGYAEIIFEEDK